MVWAQKYRKQILRGELRQQVADWFREIAGHYDITILELEVSEDHIHILCSFPPRYSIARVVARQELECASRLLPLPTGQAATAGR